jgi:integrase/recombinase XerD|nr:MAG TPA: SITE SPECIFIC RECOMBINASE XERD [Caudoviricetes sp.]
MVIEDKPWTEIVPLLFDELRKFQFTVSNISVINAKIEEIQTYALSQGKTKYSIELGQRWLSIFYPISRQFKSWKDVSTPVRDAYWSIGLLNDIFLHGFLTIRKKIRYIPLNMENEVLLLNFEKYQVENGYAEMSAKRNAGPVRGFLTMLEAKNKQIENVSEKDFIDYLSCYIDKGKAYINCIIISLKRFSKFLFDTGVIEDDLSASIPPVNKLVSPRVPSVWSGDEINKMLDSVDRGSALGKRDYAILLLAVRIGLRCSDIKALTFSDIDWEKKVICIVQRKTQKNLVLPLSDEIGWAIIDYIKNGRPKSEFPNIFLSHGTPVAPFAATTSLYGMISRYRTIAGIDLHERARRGMHSLRHTFATNLLKNGIPLETIAEMLGHVGMSSVDIYLSVETQELRRIALSPEEVYHA